MNYSFIDCDEKDLEFVLELKIQTLKWYIEKIYGWDEETQKSKTLNEIRNHKGNMKIIIKDGERIGITTLTENNNEYVIGLTMIHPNHQNKGIATSILSQFIELAKENKKRIIIKTYKENPAQNLYLRLGFKIYNTDNTHIYLEINN